MKKTNYTKSLWGLVAAFCLLSIILLLISTAIEGFVLDRKLESMSQEEQLNKSEVDSTYKINVLDNAVKADESSLISADDVISGNVKANIIVSPTSFKENLDYQSGYRVNRNISVTKTNINTAVSKYDTLALQFQAYTNKGFAKLTVSCGNTQNDIYLTQTPTNYYMLISRETLINTIQFSITSDFTETTIDSVYLINYGKDYEVASLKNGSFSAEDFSDIKLPADTAITNKADQTLINGNYIYTLEEDKLVCRRQSVYGGYVIQSSVNDLGYVADMMFTADKNHIVVTARQNGAYIIDCSYPTNLRIVARYDTVGEPNGLDISGNYLFLCERFSGVGIVDITDATNPVYVAQISDNTEYFDCYVDGEYLYVGAYNNLQVDIYNIKDLTKPKLVAEIDLDGFAEGIDVQNGIMYVATGIHSRNEVAKAWDYGRGTGNGLEIFDVTDIENPKRLSVLKMDGQSSSADMDNWDVTVSGEYAYVSSGYNGMYMYDVSDPTAPIRIAVYNAVSNIANENLSADNLYPFDIKTEDRGYIAHTVIADGYIYLSSINEGLYKVELPEAKLKADKVNNTEFVKTETEDSLDINLKKYDVKKFDTDYPVFAAGSWNEDIFLACGNYGIVRLDKNLTVKATYDTYTVRDIKISGDILYTAESAGLGVYLLGDEVQKIGNLTLSNKREILSIEISANKKYIIAQSENTYYAIIDISNPYAPIETKLIYGEFGTMYHKSLVTGAIGEDYLGIFGKDKILWYNTTEGNFDTPIELENTYYREYNGMTAVGDKCLMIANQGYFYINPKDNTLSERVKIQGISFSGKCISNGEILVICDLNAKNVQIVDVKNIKRPILLEEFAVDGNPDVACITENSILIPCRYGGLLQLTIKE